MAQQPGGENGGLTQLEQYTKIYNVLKDMESYGVMLSIPEFIFIGFQSSGKTSAVSQAAQLAVGVMKTGTASRCPTRFKLVTNPSAKKPIIKVNGQPCTDEADLTNKTLAITKTHEERDQFSNEIIEVRIESAQVPELTFVDLPGLIKSEQAKYAHSKRQLDELTAFFLHDQNPDGSYRYMPILVREPVDEEHDVDAEVNYIDKLVEQYGRNRQRANWREDTLFIVNKFDKQINRSPASQLIDYMKYCSRYGETVLTIMNAKGRNTAAMSHKQLSDFVLTVQKDEEEKWNEVLTEFMKMNDENIDELRELKRTSTGVGRMNSVLAGKMCNIVKRILPTLDNKLKLAEGLKRQAIDEIQKEIALCDPGKIREECITFNSKFLLNLQELYGGRLGTELDKSKKTWAREMQDFHQLLSGHTKALQDWATKHTLKPARLEKEIRSIKPHEKSNPAFLLKAIGMALLAGPAIERIINVWVATISLMPFPDYSDEDVLNAQVNFGPTKQANAWGTIQNLVLSASKQLQQAAHYLGEFLRYRIKLNADIIFAYSLADMYTSTDESKTPIVKLLKRSLRDYNVEVDNIIDEFLTVAEQVPREQARILDQEACEEAINVGKLLNHLLGEEASKYAYKPTPKPKPYTGPPRAMYNNVSATVDVPGPPGPPGPPTSGAKSPKAQQGKGKGAVIAQPPPPTSPPPQQQPQIRQSVTQSAGGKKARKGTMKRSAPHEMDDSKDDSKDEELGMGKSRYHRKFFKAVHGQKKTKEISIERNSPDEIRHLACCFWTNAKHVAMRDIQQKVLNLVMAPIRRMDTRLVDAIQCGVEAREVAKLVGALVKKTGVGQMQVEELIKNSGTLDIRRAVTELSPQEIAEEYGSDRQTLIAVKKKRLKELKDFKILVKKLRVKMYHIKNNTVDEIEGNDEKADMPEEEDDDDVYMQAAAQVTRGLRDDDAADDDEYAPY